MHEAECKSTSHSIVDVHAFLAQRVRVRLYEKMVPYASINAALNCLLQVPVYTLGQRG